MITLSLTYYSRKFNNHQANYSTNEKEAFALLSALQHFDVYLSAAVAPVEAFTDQSISSHTQNEEQAPEINALEFGSAGILSDNLTH